MPSQIELLAHAAVINKAIDPEGPHVAPNNDAMANMHREYGILPGSNKAATAAQSDDNTGKEGAAVMNGDEYALEDTNENNARVAERLKAEKQAIAEKLQRDKPLSFHRAGSPFNVGDLSAGGMGGDLGEAAGQQDGDAVEAQQQQSAWSVQTTAAKAPGTAKERKAAAAKAPVGSADATNSSLLGNDEPPPPPPASGEAPPNATGAAWPAPGQQGQ